MFELIRQNQRKSIVLCIGMAICMVGLGYVIGQAMGGGTTESGITGIMIAMLIWFVLSLVSYFGGDSIVMSMSGAKEISRDDHPQLFNIVEEMKIAANLQYMPKIYVVPSAEPNAFAVGLRKDKTAIAVTAGLLERLDREELQGVVAHEMSHILNRDVLFMVFAGVSLGCIVLISDLYVRRMFFTSHLSSRYSRSSSKGNAQAQLVMMAVALVVAILAPILARILYFSISRRREYLADASAVRLTRYPEGLASALESISSGSSMVKARDVNRIVAPMYIMNPLEQSMGLTSLFSTHPPINERVKILRSMSGGVGYRQYQKAFSETKKNYRNIIPTSQIMSDKTIPIRGVKETDSSSKPSHSEKRRQIGDVIMAANGYRFITCTCGLKFKLPPEFNEKQFDCPRCGNVIKTT